MNIRKNDPLLVRVQPDGTLLVTPRVSRASEPLVKGIDADAIDDPTFFLRTMVGAYITGYTEIRVSFGTSNPAGIQERGERVHPDDDRPGDHR